MWYNFNYTEPIDGFSEQHITENPYQRLVQCTSRTARLQHETLVPLYTHMIHAILVYTKLCFLIAYINTCWCRGSFVSTPRYTCTLCRSVSYLS